MEFILGVFNTPYFKSLSKENYSWHSYFDLPDNLKRWSANGEPIFIQHVYENYDKINFLLDEIRLPLSTHSITCWELKLLIECDYLDKVQFWLKGKKIATDKVLAVYNKVKNDELRFSNLDLETF